MQTPAELASTPDDGNRNLFWWPVFAGISRDGDFGFTTGAVSFDEARTRRAATTSRFGAGSRMGRGNGSMTAALGRLRMQSP
ncbi:MAG: hypothetical protein IPL62_13170 [Caulobacteraceae bacterium]|nr:hypothetical protein [Caulobacteraceae bacterium]